MPLVRIVSGGQAGVDRAALDAAIDFGLAVGGWCPKGRRAGGSRLTADTAQALQKPLLVGQLDLYDAPRAVEEFLEAHRVRTLNVAGPRESGCPGIQARAYGLLRTVLRKLDRGHGLVLRHDS